jgi:hypothetical protein
MFSGFRMKTRDDYTTNGWISPPTAFDQTLKLVSPNVYQLQKAYGIGGATELAIGLPVRTIFKPVPSTVLVAVSGRTQANWTVDTKTGLVTFPTNKAANITAISKANPAVVSVSANTFVVGDSVLVSSIGGMAQINGLRLPVTAVGTGTISLGVDSTTFSTYTSGGFVNSSPQSTEVVTGGCEFDIPCRFDSKVDILHTDFLYRGTSSIDVVELLNP